MRRVFIATSLDGFIARDDGGIDWLSSGEQTGYTGDYGYAAFMKDVDALVMGRNTFELVLTFEGGWPYGDTPVVVLTSRPFDVPEGLAGKVEVMSGTPSEVVRRLDAMGYRSLYVDGGKTIQGFLDEGLIDRMIITRIPVLIGSGIPLFGPVQKDIRLRHLETRSYETGLVQSTYDLLNDEE